MDSHDTERHSREEHAGEGPDGDAPAASPGNRMTVWVSGGTVTTVGASTPQEALEMIEEALRLWEERFGLDEPAEPRKRFD